jgi:hypothetical protein
VNYFFKFFWAIVVPRNLGGLGPLVWEEIENGHTVHKGLAKLLYRFLKLKYSKTKGHFSTPF